MTTRYFKYEISPMSIRQSFHKDRFARDHLPPEDQWPVFEFTLPALSVSDPFNCGKWLLDDALREIDPARPAIFYKEMVWTYADLAARTSQICHVLVDELGIVPGNRVLLRGANTPMMFAAWLAVMKVGAIAVSTMPMLRARELTQIVDKAKITLAICQEDLTSELLSIAGNSPLANIIAYGAPSSPLEAMMANKRADFTAVPTSQDDVCLIAFTSGTTGQPKATMHFHRDVLAMCETFARHCVPANSDSRFAGTPPIAFTFGLGGLLVFPLFFRGSMALPDGSMPAALAEAVQRFRATHLFTSPTAYKVLASKIAEYDLSSLRVCVSAGEALSKQISDLWFEKTGIRLIDGIGGTEMIHVFIAASGDDIRPGATGKPVPGYSAALFDDTGNIKAGPGTGKLGVRGPTGCRYLADPRQKDYVVNGWNMTGDVYRRDEDGYYWHVARSDDMIVTGGYNVAGPEIEAALILHPDVEECAVVGWPDEERGQIVKAVVVPKAGANAGPDLAKKLQDYVKTVMAPYKYPRQVEFVAALPKTPTGKLQRSALRAHR